MGSGLLAQAALAAWLACDQATYAGVIEAHPIRGFRPDRSRWFAPREIVIQAQARPWPANPSSLISPLKGRLPK